MVSQKTSQKKIRDGACHIMELHTYIKCVKCKKTIRASQHTPEQCEGNQ